MRSLVRLNLLTAVALGIGGFFLGAYVGGVIAEGKDYLIGTDQNDVGVFMGFLFATIGWLAGLGFFNYPVSRLLGRPARYPSEETRGTARYFRLSTDHKVIGQQWNWTYRFRGYGGVETAHLELPADQLVEFHVTSLDVTHSFWAYELGVKADAVPGVDNIAFVHTRKAGSFSIRCAELCGLWHGHMFQTGEVVSGGDFKAWISGEQRAEALNQKYLPPYSGHYFPEPQRRAG